MVLYLCNGFSESMKRDPNMKEFSFPLTEDEFTRIILNAEFKSVIGHDNLAECLTKITGKQILKNRKNITVTYEDLLLVVSITGRLPEHPTEVDYEGKVNYCFKRFEKQTTMDLLKSQEKINEIMEAQ